MSAVDRWHLYGNPGCRHENEDAANVAIEQSQGSACDCSEWDAHDATDLAAQLRARADEVGGDGMGGTSALLDEAADTIDQQRDLATAGRVLIRLLTADGEWMEIYSAASMCCGHPASDHRNGTGPCMLSTDAETWACSCMEYRANQSTLQIDGTVDITATESELLRRLTGGSQ